MKIQYTVALLLFTLFSFTSCKKEGPPGPAGADGNANVVSSNTVLLNNWSSSYDDGTEFYYTSGITWGTITQDVKDNGIVMLYFHDNTTTNWTALPYSESGTNYTYSFNYVVSTGLVTLSCEGYDISGSPGISALNGIFTVRLVAIPSSARRSNPDLDWNDYEAVKKALHLQE